jgi:Icc-related predicted phosphoesterase
MKSNDGWIQAMWIEETLRPFLQKLIGQGFYKDIVIIPGNHDRVFEYEKERAIDAIGHVPNVHFLLDEGVKINDKLFWGSPWTPWFYGNHWSFNFPDHNINPARARAHARNTWELIPDQTDVLITHGPPFSVLDECVDGFQAGCPWLADDVFKRIKPSVHIFGHIHEGYGTETKDNIQFVNACVCTLDYKPTNEVQVIEI